MIKEAGARLDDEQPAHPSDIELQLAAQAVLDFTLATRVAEAVAAARVEVEPEAAHGHLHAGRLPPMGQLLLAHVGALHPRPPPMCRPRLRRGAAARPGAAGPHAHWLRLSGQEALAEGGPDAPVRHRGAPRAQHAPNTFDNSSGECAARYVEGSGRLGRRAAQLRAVLDGARVGADRAHGTSIGMARVHAARRIQWAFRTGSLCRSLRRQSSLVTQLRTGGEARKEERKAARSRARSASAGERGAGEPGSDVTGDAVQATGGRHGRADGGVEPRRTVIYCGLAAVTLLVAVGVGGHGAVHMCAHFARRAAAPASSFLPHAEHFQRLGADGPRQLDLRLQQLWTHVRVGGRAAGAWSGVRRGHRDVQEAATREARGLSGFTALQHSHMQPLSLRDAVRLAVGVWALPGRPNITSGGHQVRHGRDNGGQWRDPEPVCSMSGVTWDADGSHGRQATRTPATGDGCGWQLMQRSRGKVRRQRGNSFASVVLRLRGACGLVAIASTVRICGWRYPWCWLRR